jgi:hypothetical protein
MLALTEITEFLQLGILYSRSEINAEHDVIHTTTVIQLGVVVLRAVEIEAAFPWHNPIHFIHYHWFSRPQYK